MTLPQRIEADAIIEAFLRLDEGRAPYGMGRYQNGNAPGHGHQTPGVWDDDWGNRNSGRVGPCEWCALWERARHQAIALRARKDRGDGE